VSFGRSICRLVSSEVPKDRNETESSLALFRKGRWYQTESIQTWPLMRRESIGDRLLPGCERLRGLELLGAATPNLTSQHSPEAEQRMASAPVVWLISERRTLLDV
jgi:hypothetical protein